MCKETILDVYCASRGCNMIVGYNILQEREPCDHVYDNSLAFGACGDIERQKLGPERAADRDMTCDGCRDKARKKGEDLYNNFPQRIAEQREHQRQLDEQGRARRGEAQRFPEPQMGHPGSVPPEAPEPPPGYVAGADPFCGHGGYTYAYPPVPGEQGAAFALVYGDGRDRFDGQGGHYGYGQAPSALGEDSFESFNALLADDADFAGWEDPGEGSSHGSGGRGSRRGGQRRR